MFPDLWSRAVHTIPVPLSFGSHRAVVGGRSRCLAVGCHPRAAGTCLFFVIHSLPQQG